MINAHITYDHSCFAVTRHYLIKKVTYDNNNDRYIRDDDYSTFTDETIRYNQTIAPKL